MNTQESLRHRVERYINFIDVKPDTKVGYRKILLEYVSYIDKLPDLPIRQDVINYRDKL